VLFGSWAAAELIAIDPQTGLLYGEAQSRLTSAGAAVAY